MLLMSTPAVPVHLSAATSSATDAGADAAGFADDDERRWQAVVQRDARADGSFFYAVRSTGVVCRPSCPSRPARRDNVSFFATLLAAQQAGYRPCKRCKPEQLTAASSVVRHAQAVAAACRAIEQSDDLLSLDQLAQTAGLSRFHFHRLFKQQVGLTPRAYAEACRAQRVRERLVAGASVTDAMYEAGFNSSGRFYAAAPAMLGMRPGVFRSGGKGETIRFAVAQCWLGAVLVAATGNGICAVTLGDDPAQLVHDLQDRFLHAELVGADDAFEQWVAQVLSAIETPGSHSALPLDVRGTAFQQRVWQALLAVPAGQRLSYAELAQRIGQPKAVRAVASACAANAIAVLIPCHRVVRTDGALSGYRWGVQRKQALLEREQDAMARE